MLPFTGKLPERVNHLTVPSSFSPSSTGLTPSGLWPPSILKLTNDLPVAKANRQVSALTSMFDQLYLTLWIIPSFLKPFLSWLPGHHPILIFLLISLATVLDFLGWFLLISQDLKMLNCPRAQFLELFPLGNLTHSHSYKRICTLVTPKFLSPAQIFPLNSKLIYPTAHSTLVK